MKVRTMGGSGSDRDRDDEVWTEVWERKTFSFLKWREGGKAEEKSHAFSLPHLFSASILAAVPLAAALRLREAATDATISSSPQEQLHFSSTNPRFSPRFISGDNPHLQDLSAC